MLHIFAPNTVKSYEAVEFHLPKKIIDKFITTYTYLEPKDFTDEMRKRLVMSVMIDLHASGYNCINRPIELPAEKIELPKFIFQ